jgi:ribosomal protein S18 acetylase RimI-like enzyme
LLQIDLEKINVKRASVDYAEGIVSLLDEAARWVQSKGIDQWRPGSFDKQELLDQINDGEIFIAVYAGFLVGTFKLQMHDKSVSGELDSGEDYAYIHRLAIKPDLKGQRIGLHLLRRAEAIAKSMGKKGIRLDCIQENSILKRYYEHVAGYKPMGDSQPLGYKASLFEKELVNLGDQEA